jgi:hypothetical protein
MNLLEARALALATASAHRLPDGVVFVDDQTVTMATGWVFFYQSETFARTGDLLHAYVGSGGILVTKTGAVHELGSARPLEWYLDNFAATGDPSHRPGRVLELISVERPRTHEALMVLRRHLGLPLDDARRTLVAASTGDPPTVRTDSPEAAVALKRDLLACGVVAHQLPELAE